ncbi:uncharacterized protein LOC116935715 [Daphnia magna]|uniref:uncharacterized protein LOC116935715 n=1 Tax=Daphnia magna TaxID=35525 RepID=UPI001E1BDA0D|nr:uncharacterized protein LOC116935715 [Daphnia magna]
MRDVLRGVTSLYNPLGFYSPLTTSGKIFLQDLHKEKMKLDEVMSTVNLERWKEIVSAITKAVQHQLMSQPRHYFPSSSSDRELHVFCDASRRAYGAVAYLQHKGKGAFVIAKSRVAPLKNEKKEGEREISIPEAELMAAFIGTLIAETVLAALELQEFKTQGYLWSDSQIVHFFISKSEGHPRQFIINRVKNIRDFNRRRAAT